MNHGDHHHLVSALRVYIHHLQATGDQSVLKPYSKENRTVSNTSSTGAGRSTYASEFDNLMDRHQGDTSWSWRSHQQSTKPTVFCCFDFACEQKNCLWLGVIEAWLFDNFLKRGCVRSGYCIWHFDAVHTHTPSQHTRKHKMSNIKGVVTLFVTRDQLEITTFPKCWFRASP